MPSLIRICLLLVMAVAGSAAGAAEALSARAAVSANSVFVGEPFRLQIQISGSETPERPDLSVLKDFRAEFTGGGSNTRSSVTVVNGKITRNEQLGYVFNYEVRARAEGRFRIPPIKITSGAAAAQTQALVITVQKPSETENFKLRLSLSKEQAYVGEQLVLEVTFYYRANVSEPQLSLPFNDHPAFEMFELDGGQPQKQEMLDGRQFKTLRVRRVIVPREAGQFTLEPATLTFQGADGVEMARDFFGRQVRRPKFKRLVIPSNELQLTVQPLPKEGRPVNFAGHVGEYSVSLQASPTEVNVGDPITLNISMAGPLMLDAVKAPALRHQESLTKDFKVPNEIADGAVNGSFKVFTQTIRPLREDVKSVPPIELPYFDTAKGSYELARSAAVPLVVRATRVVTADDAEGMMPLAGAKQEIQSWMQGIAHNYSGADVLSSQSLGFAGLRAPARLGMIVGPPLAYALVFGWVTVRRRRNSNPEIQRQRKAQGAFQRAVAQADDAEAVLAALRSYLGDKLALTSDALTWRDVESPLVAKGVDESLVKELRELFRAGEMSQYAGGEIGGDVAGFRGKAATVVRELERML